MDVRCMLSQQLHGWSGVKCRCPRRRNGVHAAMVQHLNRSGEMVLAAPHRTHQCHGLAQPYCWVNQRCPRVLLSDSRDAFVHAIRLRRMGCMGAGSSMAVTAHCVGTLCRMSHTAQHQAV